MNPVAQPTYRGQSRRETPGDFRCARLARRQMLMTVWLGAAPIRMVSPDEPMAWLVAMIGRKHHDC